MRFTEVKKEIIDDEEIVNYHLFKDDRITQIRANHKLGKYEDLDEKLGITYDILIQVMLNGFYFDTGWHGIKHVRKPILRNVDGEIVFQETCYFKYKAVHHKLSDFNKTWFLNKEDVK